MTSILTRDLLMNFLMGLTALVILTLAAINPTSTEEQMSQPGNIAVLIGWPAGPDDVDMWVQYDNTQAVGYANKSGRVWSLLRDDLGTANDSTPLNYESAFTRGLPDGEYAVNVRCFSCLGPVRVGVEIRLASGSLVWKGAVDLVTDKQERTALRWRMANGAVVAGSASSVFKQMNKEGK